MWNHRTGSGVERFAAWLVVAASISAFFGAWVAPAEDLRTHGLTALEEVPVVSESDLSGSREGAVLPWGMSVEVSAMTRVLVDGEDLEASSVASSFPLGLESGTWAVLGDSSLDALTYPMAITNSDNAISIGQFREISIEIRDVPISLGTMPVFPAEVFSSSLVP